MGLLGGMMGMLNPFEGLTSIISNLSDAILEKFDILVGTIEKKIMTPIPVMGAQTIEPTSIPMTTSGLEEGESTNSVLESPSSILSLEQKLDTIAKLLAGKQNISLKVNNKLTYDAFSENTTTYLNGKSSQDQVNDSSFI